MSRTVLRNHTLAFWELPCLEPEVTDGASSVPLSKFG